MIVASCSKLAAPALATFANPACSLVLDRSFAAAAELDPAQKFAPNEENQKLLALPFGDLCKLVETRHQTGPQRQYRLIQLATKAKSPDHFAQLLEVWKKERILRAAREIHKPFISHAAQALFKAGFRVGADEKVLDVLHHAREYSIKPTRRMLEGLIFHLAKHHQFELMERAYLYAHVYLGRPTKTMLANMISGYTRARNMERAKELVQEASNLKLDISFTEKNVVNAASTDIES